MVFAATRMLSSSRLMSRSADRDAPMALSCSSLWTRSSAAVAASPENRSAWVLSNLPLILSGRALLLDANRAHLLHVSEPHHDLVHAVHLQGRHPLFDGFDEQVGDARSLLDELLNRIGGNHEFMQARAALV